MSEPYFSKNKVLSGHFGYLEGYYFLMLVNSKFQGTRVGYQLKDRQATSAGWKNFNHYKHQSYQIT